MLRYERPGFLTETSEYLGEALRYLEVVKDKQSNSKSGFSPTNTFSYKDLMELINTAIRENNQDKPPEKQKPELNIRSYLTHYVINLASFHGWMARIPTGDKKRVYQMTEKNYLSQKICRQLEPSFKIVRVAQAN